ncbi:Integral membrane protein OS=Streptomyces aurantiogriseus OX=66870 GN=GCM10010251_54020 PE=4 SV=1 [Streptomyces aurantiogriseus]
MRTLAVSSTLMAGLSLLMGTLVMVGAVGVMGMDAAHLPLLWPYSVCAMDAIRETDRFHLLPFGLTSRYDH